MNDLEILYGTISADGSRYSLTFKATKNQSARLEGYSEDVFKDRPGNYPIIDFRTANFGDVLRLVLNHSIIEACSHPWHDSIPFIEYLNKAKDIGATIINP